MFRNNFCTSIYDAYIHNPLRSLEKVLVYLLFSVHFAMLLNGDNTGWFCIYSEQGMEVFQQQYRGYIDNEVLIIGAKSILYCYLDSQGGSLHASQGSHNVVPARFLFILCPLRNDDLQRCVYWVSLYCSVISNRI